MARQPQAASIASLLESWGGDGKNDSQNFIWGMQALEVHSALAEKGDGTAVRNTVAWWQMALLLCDPGRVLYCYSEMMHVQRQSRQHGQKETLHQ